MTDLIEKLRSEAEISDRSGQFDRRNEIADELAAVLKAALEARIAAAFKAALEARAATPAPASAGAVSCYDCGLQYGGPSWIEALIPDKAWNLIRPEGTNEGCGILCISCIAKRLREHGIEYCPVWLCGTEPLRPFGQKEPEDNMTVLRQWEPGQPSAEGEAKQPAADVGEEIMVNTPYDVFILPLQPSGLSSGPRFVVHVPGPEQPSEQHPDDAAVDRFAAAMKAKLKKKRQEGYGGWQSMTSEQLSALLHEHVRKGDPVDVANLAMMLHQNEQVIEPPATVVTDEMVEALRAEVEEWKRCAEAQAALHDEAEDCAEELAKALAGLITWIPSADTFKRLGFDPAAPMRALERAKLALGRGGLGND